MIYFDFYIVKNFTLFKEKYKNNKYTYELMIVFRQRGMTTSSNKNLSQRRLSNQVHMSLQQTIS